MLGLARRAGKLSCGHDASFEAIEKGKARICFLTCDASDRLKEEFKRTTVYNGRNIPCIEINYDKDKLHVALNIRAAVLTVNDNGFAEKLIELSDIKSGLKEDNN